jgi:hypothetical protein
VRLVLLEDGVGVERVKDLLHLPLPLMTLAQTELRHHRVLDLQVLLRQVVGVKKSLAAVVVRLARPLADTDRRRRRVDLGPGPGLSPFSDGVLLDVAGPVIFVLLDVCQRRRAHVLWVTTRLGRASVVDGLVPTLLCVAPDGRVSKLPPATISTGDAARAARLPVRVPRAADARLVVLEAVLAGDAEALADGQLSARQRSAANEWTSDVRPSPRPRLGA